MQKLLLAIGAAILLFGAVSVFNQSTPSLRQSSIIMKWGQYKTKYNKNFNSVEEETYRFEIFINNLKYIEQENQKGHTHTLGENSLMDLTNAEFKQMYLATYETKGDNKADSVHKRIEYPDSVDWTETPDKVQQVKDQGQCGSCWAFSAIGATESADAVFNNHLGDYSEQQLVDCSGSFGNHGCGGGLMNNAFKYIVANGITDEESYPYEAKDQKCQTKSGSFKIAGFTKVAKKILDSECKDLKSAIAQQPVAVGVDAETWQFYSGGIFTNCGKQLDHGVLAVGYTADAWKIKNSWSASWGEKGFIRLGKGNTCGICNTASYPNTTA